MLTLNDIDGILSCGRRVAIAPSERERMERCYDFLVRFAREKVIYGINTGFGPMAQWRIADEDLQALQYNIIRSHSTGAGEALPARFVKAAMVARLQTFLLGYSGVSVEIAELLCEFIDRDIIPYVPRHGSVGASGDLVQLAHIALALIGEGEVFWRGERRPTAEVFAETGLRPMRIHTREGLAATNGTAVMTGIASVNLLDAHNLLRWAAAASVMINEVASSFDDFLSSVLNGLKGHEGQNTIAEAMRSLAEGGGMMMRRETELYRRHDEKKFDHKVQPYYSLRCTPQILGPVLETLWNAERVVTEELNGVDDNPIVDPDSRNVYHGGNFHGDYISLEMDKVKTAVAKMTMLAERQMNYLFHDRINGILPPFVNLGKAGLNYGMQAAQFTATSTTAESQTLSMPMYVHSIPNNNDNQDVVSMGTNSALLAAQVIDNGYQVMAIHLVALAQAVDCLDASGRLAPATRAVYDAVRGIVPTFADDKPLYNRFAAVEAYIRHRRLDILPLR